MYEYFFLKDTDAFGSDSNSAMIIDLGARLKAVVKMYGDGPVTGHDRARLPQRCRVLD